MKREYLYEPYPLNFLKTIAINWNFDVPTEITNDIAAGVQYVISTLSDKGQKVIYYRYQERKTYEEIAEIMSLSIERIRQIEYNALHKLQKPYRWNIMQYGVIGYTQKMSDLSYERGYNEGYTVGYHSGVHNAGDGVEKNLLLLDCLKQPIEQLNLSVRSFNCLKRSGYNTVGEVSRLDNESIQQIKSLKKNNKNEIANVLENLGINHTAWSIYL